MNHPRPTMRAAAVLSLLCAASVAGCGGSTDGGGDTTTSSATVPAATTRTAPPTGTSTGSGAPGAGTGTTGTATSDPGSTATTAGRPKAGSRTRLTAVVAGTTVAYTLVLPDGYVDGTPAPTLLALPPGGQGRAEVDALLDKWWAAEGRRRGWIVVSPEAPAGGGFFGPSSALLPGLVDQLAASYPAEGGKVHVAGVSNGGLSAFRFALDNPRRVASLLAAPGFPPETGDAANLERLVSIPVALYVGANDAGWREPSARTVGALRELGGRATLTVSPGEGHILMKISARQLYDRLDGVRRRS